MTQYDNNSSILWRTLFHYEDIHMSHSARAFKCARKLVGGTIQMRAGDSNLSIQTQFYDPYNMAFLLHNEVILGASRTKINS